MFGKNNKKIINIAGMHCQHCANKVKETLQTIPGVDKVKVNLSKNEAIITSKKEIDNQLIQDSFNNLDFKIISIK